MLLVATLKIFNFFKTVIKLNIDIFVYIQILLLNQFSSKKVNELNIDSIHN